MEQTTLMGSVKSEESVGTKHNTESAATTPATSGRTSGKRRKGLTLARRFTQSGTDVFGAIVWERRQSVITNPDGSIVFKMQGAEIPAGWSQPATDIVVSKYF